MAKKKDSRIHGMQSTRPRLVARDVIGELQAGRKPFMGKILAKRGYSKSVQVSPAQITSLPSFKDEFESYVARLEKERTRVLAAMESTPLGEVAYKDLVEAGKKITHDIQLLTGGKTENRGVEEDRNTLIMIMRDIRGELPAPVEGEVIDQNYARPSLNGEVQGASEAI